jgi:hypothetical protein
MAPLAQLAADRSDDRHRQIGGAAEYPNRHWLEPCKGREDRLDAAGSLGEPNSPRDILDYAIRQRHEGRR